MIKPSYYLIVLLISFASSSCLFPESKKDREEKQEKELTDYIEQIEYQKKRQLDTTDYSKIEISKDSIDQMLYELIQETDEFKESVLLKNIENLIERGANPNAMVEINYSVRKTGTYIPIVKHFYRKKYRNYTKVTSSMHMAVATGRTKIVQLLLDKGGDINIKNPNDNNLLDIALANDNSQMVDFLVKSGIKTSNVNLANTQNTKLIEKLVGLGADPKTIDLNYALEDISTLKRLLAIGADINNAKLNFKTIMNDDELLNLLLDNGLSPSTIGKFPDGCPLLFAAIKYGNFEAFKKLIGMGANIKEVCKSGFGDTPMQRAIYYQQTDMIKYLLEKGVSANEKDWTKKSLLILACNTDNDEIINILIDAGAQLEYKGYFSKTPLLHAAEFDKYIAAEALINKGANVNFKDKYGDTPLIAAIKKNNYPMIKLLVEKGAKTSIKYKSMDLVQLAEEEEASPAVVSYLKKFVKK